VPTLDDLQEAGLGAYLHGPRGEAPHVRSGRDT
jgi:hypothetical protein